MEVQSNALVIVRYPGPGWACEPDGSKFIFSQVGAAADQTQLYLLSIGGLVLGPMPKPSQVLIISIHERDKSLCQTGKCGKYIILEPYVPASKFACDLVPHIEVQISSLLTINSLILREPQMNTRWQSVIENVALIMLNVMTGVFVPRC